jgi:FtsZ-binding cell division protein ZapB
MGAVSPAQAVGPVDRTLEAETEALAARHAAWQAEFQRLLGLAPARPSG